MHINFDHVLDRMEYQDIEFYHYIKYLYNVNHNYYMHEINPVDKNLDLDQDEMEMNEYNQLILNNLEDLFAMHDDRMFADIQWILMNLLDIWLPFD